MKKTQTELHQILVKFITENGRLTPIIQDEQNNLIIIDHPNLPNINCAYTIFETKDILPIVLKLLIELDPSLQIYPKITFSEIIYHKYIVIGFSSMDTIALSKKSLIELTDLLLKFRNYIIDFNILVKNST